jgi:hypothetical protein
VHVLSLCPFTANVGARRGSLGSHVKLVNSVGHHLDAGFQSIAAKCAKASIKAWVPLRP